MVGNDWGRLVAAPTTTELDAALAEVRVRAIPIAQRRARNRRALSVLGFLALAGGGLVAGRMSAAPDLGLDLRDSRVVSSPVMIADGPETPLVRAAIQHWHITAWDEMEGYRWNGGEAWVEGPNGTGFRIRMMSDEASVDIRVEPWLLARMTQLRTRATLSRQLGSLPYNYYAGARKNDYGDTFLRPGQAAVYYPFGRSVPLRTTIRIEGPFVALPADVRWARPDSLRYRSWTASQDELAAARIGVRHSNSGALYVAPFYGEPGEELRLRLAGNAESTDVYVPAGDMAVFALPGVGRMGAQFSRIAHGSKAERCLNVFSLFRTNSGRKYRGTTCLAGEQQASAELSLQPGDERDQGMFQPGSLRVIVSRIR